MALLHYITKNQYTQFMVGSMLKNMAKLYTKLRFAGHLISSLLLAGLIIPSSIAAKVTLDKFSNYQDAQFLSFNEIQILSNHKTTYQATLNKLHSLFSVPIYQQIDMLKLAALKYDLDQKKNYLRVSHWNIERGLHIQSIEAIFSDTTNYINSNLKEATTDQWKQLITEEANLLKETDIFTLNEVDIGIQRTDYRNIAAEMARIMNAGYVFIPEFLEVDPSLLNDPNLDRNRYKGLHGNAIISKYPIRDAEAYRLPVCHDWFEEELRNLSFIEKARRSSSDVVIKEEITTEVRRGGRVALIADIVLPNRDIITVVSAHLENRTLPKCREQQMQALLEHLKYKVTPVIMGADLNNFETSAEATSLSKIVSRTVSDPQNLAKAAITYFNPYALIVNTSSVTVGHVRKHRDPTVVSIPIILRNKARKLFTIIKKQKFIDGNQFDFEGDDELSYQKQDGKLSNSNQRAKKGFVETYQFNRALGIGYFKIDWIFVKSLPGLGNTKHYYPAFGRTLKDLNHSYKDGKLSDHSPVTVQVMI